MLLHGLLALVALGGLAAALAAFLARAPPHILKRKQTEDVFQLETDATGAKALTAPASAPEWNLGTSLASPSPILRLYADLAAVFAAERRAGYVLGSSQAPESFERLNAAVRGLVGSYIAAGHADWRAYVKFNDLHYVRHLVEANDDFELMLLCWKRGQGSRVHNHAESHCWLSVLAGQVDEVQCRPLDCRGLVPRKATNPAAPPPIPGVLAAASPCPDLEHVQTGRLQVGNTGYINDTIALHAVRCPADCEGEGAVTLHIYSPPIKRVYLFEPDTDRVVYRVPGFYTVRGAVTQHA